MQSTQTSAAGLLRTGKVSFLVDGMFSAFCIFPSFDVHAISMFGV